MNSSRSKVKPIESLQKLNDQLLQAKEQNNQILIRIIQACIKKIQAMDKKDR